MTGQRPLIAFYNRFFDDWPATGCAEHRPGGTFSIDPSDLAGADAVVFHLPTAGCLCELVKPPGQLWVGWSLESDVTVPAVSDPASLVRFDLTMTYQQDASVWYPYVGLASLAALTAAPVRKTAAYPVCHFQSNRYDRSGRTAYAAELLKRVKIDSYGTVLPTVADPGQVRGRDARLAVMARHKFTLAFENSIATDYVSDKFFDSLIAGSVPVYLGAANVADFAPAERSFVNVADFSGPAELASYLNYLDRSPAEYETYLRWKHDGVSCRFLDLLARVPAHPFCRLAELVSATTPDRSQNQVRLGADAAIVGSHASGGDLGPGRGAAV
jgi:alpha-1,3-fucosyltransferase 10